MWPGSALQSARSAAMRIAVARTGTWRPQAQSYELPARRELKNGTRGRRISTWCGLLVHITVWNDTGEASIMQVKFCT
jgi:hypothetical protein